jgi:polar amino acid transport system permease protein
MDWIADFYNYRIVEQYLPLFYRGFMWTVAISLMALALSLAIGLGSALMRMSKNPWLWRPAATYIQAIRSTPLLIQLYVIYYGFPAFPIIGRLDELECGVLALGLNAGAYMSEIIRSGIESIPKGQVEAAQSVGMTYLQRMKNVVLPQAFARVAPTLMGQTAVLFKDSSMVSFISLFELMSAGLKLYDERLKPNEAYLTVAMLYLVIYFIMLGLTNMVQRRAGGTMA